MFDEMLEHCSALSVLACKLHSIGAEDNFDIIREINALSLQIHKLRTKLEGLNRKQTNE